MSLLSDKSIFKSLVAGCVAASIDIVVYKNTTNYKGTLLLASTVSASSFIASKAASSIPDFTGTKFDTQYTDSATIQQRLLELTLASSASFILNKYVFKNLRNLPVYEYAFIFGSSSFLSEYITDYVFQDKLSYLN